VTAAIAQESDASDLRLMAKVARGDAHAQRVLATRLAPRVQRICFALLRDRSDAEEAAQVSLLEILRGAASFAGTGSLERWAERIAARHALRHAARERRRSAPVDRAVDPEQVIGADDPTTGVLDATPRTIHEYLGRLPSDRRELLVLRHALDYSVREIAELVGLPHGTVKERLLVARAQLRKLMLRDIAIGVGRSG
jgi:RNA polymerase sigma-70 factor (ECF subfamily)